MVSMEFGVGSVLEGKVTGITKFGAFVSLPGGKSGLVHISEIAYTYVNDVKEKVLGVSGDVLGTQGAVDELVALQMARGALRDMGSDVAVSVTGIAGPAGAEPGKPVGTVWISCATVRGTHATRYQFEGGREAVRLQTVLAALQVMGEALEG